MEKHPIDLGNEHHDGSWVLQKIYESSQLNFNAITKNVSLKFSHLVKMIRNHDLEKMLKKDPRDPASDKEAEVVIPSNLLVELTESPPNKEKKSVNLLSGVFMIGVLIGCIAAIGIAMIMINSKIEITQQVLVYAGLGFLAALLLLVGIPMLLAAIEPQLKKIQEIHHDFVDRFMGMFQ